MLLPLWRLLDNGIRADDLATIVVPAAIGAAALVLFLPRRFVLALPAARARVLPGLAALDRAAHGGCVGGIALLGHQQPAP